MKLRFVALVSFLLPAIVLAQNFPDRLVCYDPLADHRLDTIDADWLTSERLHAEFGRYSNGSGSDHRWNAKIGGFVELGRWDSSWSLALVGTTEIVIDPNNSVGFNPRSIFWEEGLLLSYRLGHDATLQFGGMQRCKHDIDNLELSYNTGTPDERTLIFSSASVRLLWRPHSFVPGLEMLRGGLALRNEFYIHLLDHRIPGERNEVGEHLDRTINTTLLSGRLELRPPGRVGAHLSGSVMMNVRGGRIGAEDRFDAITVSTAVPHLELGLDLVNPSGTAVTCFVRGEWQNDAAIAAAPRAATLVLFGFRFAGDGVIW